jgi:hypothetical protein
MNKPRLIGALSAAVFCIVSLSSHATLLSRLGGQAAYDDALGITWVTNASLSGLKTWDNQVAWADGLDFLGFNDWRLASMSVAAGLPTGSTTSVVDCSSATELACQDNELGYMFYQNMGGSLFDDNTENQTVDGVLLSNVQTRYWSGNEFNSDDIWVFRFTAGDQFRANEGNSVYGWAVRSGDVGVVPVPAAVWLFGSGLIGLLGLARRKR